jgi:release factor glutamine methyltransferase
MPTTLEVFGVAVTLERAEGVFMPSPNGLFYARSIRVSPGERVIDIGTGSGVLAIAAAKRGARVTATDVDPRAVAAAERNARLNGVTIECRVGALFAGVDEQFDVILANLPNEIVAPAHLERLGSSEARAIDGGKGGNEHLLALLGAAHAHMHQRSRLYLGVHTLTDYHATLRAALRDYVVRLIDLMPLPAKSFVAEHLDFYRPLDDAGVIHIFQGPDGKWQTFGYVYELTRREGSSGAGDP